MHDPVLLGNYSQRATSEGRSPTRRTTLPRTWPARSRGLRFDYRRPKHPYSDKFSWRRTASDLLALWMIMGQALARRYEATGDRRYYVIPRWRAAD